MWGMETDLKNEPSRSLVKQGPGNLTRTPPKVGTDYAQGCELQTGGRVSVPTNLFAVSYNFTRPVWPRPIGQYRITSRLIAVA